jgi:hypothetical protein
MLDRAFWESVKTVTGAFIGARSRLEAMAKSSAVVKLLCYYLLPSNYLIGLPS